MKLFQKLFHVLWSTLQLSPEVVDLLGARCSESGHGDKAGGERQRVHSGSR